MGEPLFMLLPTSYDQRDILGPLTIQNDAPRLTFQYLTPFFFLTIQLFFYAKVHPVQVKGLLLKWFLMSEVSDMNER